MLSFSVESRQWKWDCDVVDMTMISDGVAELLTTLFSQLPSALMKTLKVISCLGYQVETSTLEALNSRNEVLPFSMQTQLELAVQEGIMEKAGPVFQFSHDIILHTIYTLLPTDYCKMLHKIIGTKLLKFTPVSDPIHLIAVDQINLFCAGARLTREDRSQFAIYNAKAAKIAIEKTNFGSGQCSSHDHLPA
jgi:predicted ATPase